MSHGLRFTPCSRGFNERSIPRREPCLPPPLPRHCSVEGPHHLCTNDVTTAPNRSVRERSHRSRQHREDPSAERETVVVTPCSANRDRMFPPRVSASNKCSGLDRRPAKHPRRILRKQNQIVRLNRERTQTQSRGRSTLRVTLASRANGKRDAGGARPRTAVNRRRVLSERRRRFPQVLQDDEGGQRRSRTVPGTEPVALPRRPFSSARVTSPAQPAVELLLDRPLDDQPSAEPGELGQHLLRVIDYASREQLVDARLYLRRRRTLARGSPPAHQGDGPLPRLDSPAGT